MNILTTLAQSTYYYDSSYYTTSNSNLSDADAAAFGAFFMVFLTLYILVIVTLYVVTALSLMKIFKKAGIQQTWAAWVPIYNSWKMLEIGGQPGFWAALALIPFVNIASLVFMYIAMYNIGLKLGKSGAFVVLGIFLPIVWIIWLAVDKSTWNESAGAPSLAQGTASPTPPTSPVV